MGAWWGSRLLTKPRTSKLEDPQPVIYWLWPFIRPPQANPSACVKSLCEKCKACYKAITCAKPRRRMPLMVAEQQPELPLNMYINNRSNDNRMQQPGRELRGRAGSQGEIGQSRPAAPGAHYAQERQGKLAMEKDRKHSNLVTPEQSGGYATGIQKCPRISVTANALVRTPRTRRAVVRRGAKKHKKKILRRVLGSTVVI